VLSLCDPLIKTTCLVTRRVNTAAGDDDDDDDDVLDFLGVGVVVVVAVALFFREIEILQQCCC